MKVLELILGRSADVLVDGQRHNGRWNYNVGDGDTLVSDDLKIGGSRIKSIEVTGKKHESSELENPGPPAYHIFKNYLEPERVVVVSDQGRFSGPITVVKANPDDEELEIIKLHSGEDFAIDEVTLYLRAELAN
jgi:hypothetical protein